jgi:hypothetical protein
VSGISDWGNEIDALFDSKVLSELQLVIHDLDPSPDVDSIVPFQLASPIVAGRVSRVAIQSGLRGAQGVFGVLGSTNPRRAPRNDRLLSTVLSASSAATFAVKL